MLSKTYISSRLSSIFLAIAFIWFVSVTGALAETVCQVADPKDQTLNVRDAPGGDIINRLRNDRIVYISETSTDSRGRVWAKVYGSYRGESRFWGWMFRTSLKCIDTDRLPSVKAAIPQLYQVGILPHGASTPMFPNSCTIVPNGWGVSVSHELMAKYRARGFSEVAVCLALGASGVNFDPATGRRIPLYSYPGQLEDPHPLWLPDCFKSVEIEPNMNYIVGWRPTGCRMRYNPTTGLKITDPSVIELTSGGEAGGGIDEDDQSSSVSEARLAAMVNGE